MLRVILRHEWRVVRAERTAWVAIVLFAGVAGYGVHNGHQWTRAQRDIQETVLSRDEIRLDSLARLARAQEDSAVRAGRTDTRPQFGARHAGFMGIFGGTRHAALPVGPLAASAIGQSDLLPSHYRVYAGRHEAPFNAEVTESPVRLMVGHFDLAFVILFFYPLLILALTYDLVAGERERGTLALALAQPVRLSTIVSGKVLLRALIVLVSGLGSALAGFLAGGGDLGAPGAIGRLLLWVAAVLAYGSFWFALAVWVNVGGRRAATNAVILATCWLAFVVVVPVVLNLLATTLYPVPSRVEYVNAIRRGTNDATARQAALLQQFYTDHPELAPDDPASSAADFSVLRLVRDLEIARQVAPVSARFDEQLARQHRLVNRLRYLSPALLMQAVLYDLAGTGVERHHRFRTQVAAFQQEWEAFFEPRIVAQRPFLEHHAMPRFTWREEPLGRVAVRTGALLAALMGATLALGWFGVRGLAGYRVAG